MEIVFGTNVQLFTEEYRQQQISYVDFMLLLLLTYLLPVSGNVLVRNLTRVLCNP